MNKRAMVGRRCGIAATWLPLLLVVACGGSETTLDPIEFEDTTTQAETTELAATTVAEVETTEVDELSSEQSLAEAEAEVESVIIAWATYATDTSLGEEGLPLEYLTDQMHDRYAAIGTRNESNGWITKSLGNDRVEVLSLEVDQAAGTAEATICIAGDLERRDITTDEILGADDGVPGQGSIFAKRVDTSWKLSEFIFSRAIGDNVPCEFSDG